MKTEEKSRFERMTIDEIFQSVIINKENWSTQKQEAVDYICKKLADLQKEIDHFKKFEKLMEKTAAKITVNYP